MMARHLLLSSLIAANLTWAASADPYGLCAAAASGHSYNLRLPDFSAVQTHVQAFYQSRDCSLGWVRNNAPTAAARELVAALKNADAKGLNAADYDATLWDPRLSAFNSAGPADLAFFDLALTVSAIRYLSDLHGGRFNPGSMHAGFDADAATGGVPVLVRRLADGESMDSIVRIAEPPYPEYHRIETALRRLLAAPQEPDLPALTPPAKTIGFGDRYEAAAQLAARLRQLNRIWGDVSVDDPPAPALYTRSLATAISHFQAHHGLEPDGRLGSATVAELNVPVAHRIQQLQFALEHWRWLPHSFRRPPIVVNLPEFVLRAYNSDLTPELTMKVVVGKPIGHQTPVFAGEMRQVVFHPYWDVPLDIQRDEIVPKLRRDPKYLEKNGYEIVTAHNAPVTNPIDSKMLQNLESGSFHIRQVPGSKNALGPIKFLFPNEYDVYLHGTPERGLFSLARRDFSHGCIRVQRPEDLANWVFRDNPKWTPNDVRDALEEDETVTVYLAKPIPVLVTYTTATVTETGEVRFFPDIYSQDADLLAKIEAAKANADSASMVAERALTRSANLHR